MVKTRLPYLVYFTEVCLEFSVETRLQCWYRVSVDFHTTLDHLWFSPSGMLLKEDDSCHFHSFLLHTLSSARTPRHGGSSTRGWSVTTGAELLTCGVIFWGSQAWDFTPRWFQHATSEQKGECFRTYFTWKPGAFWKPPFYTWKYPKLFLTYVSFKPEFNGTI